MGINKIPFTGIYGITSLSDGSNVSSAILSGATPLSAQATAGGYSGKYLVAVGASTEIINLFVGPPTPAQLNTNAMWVVEFGAADILTNDLYTGDKEPGALLVNQVGQNVGKLYMGERYQFDTAAICEMVITNILTSGFLTVTVWELYQQ